MAKLRTGKTLLAFALSTAMIVSLPAAFATADDDVVSAGQDTVNADSTGETAGSEGTANPEEITSSEETVAPGETARPEETALPEETTSPEETVAPEETATPEETAAPEETTSPEETAVPEETTSPEETAAPEETIPAVGTKFTVGNYSYKITSADTVTLKGLAEGVSLTSVVAKNKVVYNGVTYKINKIGSAAFQGQTSIKKVVIRKNIADIGKKAFYGCKNVTTVKIRAGVTIIRKKAFMNCSKLGTVNITSTILSDVKADAFKNIKYGAVINVMKKSIRLLVKAAVPATVSVNKI